MENPNIPPTLQLRDDERKKVEEFDQQRMRVKRRVSLGMMSGIGALFIVGGILPYLTNQYGSKADAMSSLIFVLLGAFLILLGVILFRLLPYSTDSDKVVRRAIVNVNTTPADMHMVLQLCAKRIGELEARVDALETEIRNSYPRN